MTHIIFGVDVGGVILDKANDDTDTSFLGDNFLETTTVPFAIGALVTIRSFLACLAEVQGRPYDPKEPPIHVVSKCGPNVQRKTMLWMKHHVFHEITGIPESHVHFCLKRHEKAPICKDLGITDFVDDKLEVLSYLESVPHRYLFRPSDREVARFRRHLPLVTRMNSWNDVVRAITIDRPAKSP